MGRGRGPRLFMTTVAGGTPGGKIAWHLIGVRKAPQPTIVQVRLAQAQHPRNTYATC